MWQEGTHYFFSTPRDPVVVLSLYSTAVLLPNQDETECVGMFPAVLLENRSWLRRSPPPLPAALVASLVEFKLLHFFSACPFVSVGN